MGGGNGWQIERVAGPASEFHGRDLPDDGRRHAWWFDVATPSLVLGSTQQASVADAKACANLGIDVVNRRSGGGAVLMVPDQILWLDVLVPIYDPLWDDDIGRAMWWLGDVWAAALGSLGVADVEVVHGALVPSDWSRLVCFDGLGPGEVLVGGRKAVGISQRRTREWTRLQSAAHLRWDPELIVDLLADPRPAAGDLAPVYELEAAADAVIAAVTAALATR